MHRLDAATSSHRLLEHPFYQAWAAGELSLEDRHHYSTQYFRQVQAFPGYLAAVADRLPEGPAQETVLENLSDEIDGDHLGLWMDFAAALGADEVTLQSTPPAPETTACIKSFEAGAAGSSAFALGMLYGYEAQTPGVAATKISGLEKHYGISGEPTRYFALHGEMDVEHARDLASALGSLSGDENLSPDLVAEAEAGAAAGAQAIWGLLDGVVRERALC
jgi:pyrroloquinoline-quinone synthase